MANNSVVTQEAFLDFYADNIRPYLNGATHTGFTPVGTVISYFGETAPEYFLVCDGTEYAKSDYPQLADLLLNLTDPTPFEGSDTDHFKVPDLRGEFLRGSGTNSHTDQGSGGDVGAHQDATTNLAFNISDSGSTINVRKDNNSGIRVPSNYDFETYVTSQIAKITANYPNTSSISQGTLNTSRPTNTSVLYCIAYKNIYIDLALDSFPLGISNPTDGQLLMYDATAGRWVNGGHKYSTDEHIVGTWIDGKPIYEKTFTGQRFGTITNGTYSAVHYSVDGLNIDFGWCTDALVLVDEGYDAYGKRVNCATGIYGYVSSNTTYNLPTVPVSGTINFYSSVAGQSNCMTYVIIRYTKTTD